MNNEFKTEEIYQRISENVKTLEDCINGGKIPFVNFGRQAGHSTAIIQFIKDNPELRFAILSPNIETHREYLYRLSDVSNIEKVYRKFTDDVDYIIVDTMCKFYERMSWLDKYCRGKQNILRARIIQVGA